MTKEIKVTQEEAAAFYYNSEMLPLAQKAFELGFFTLARMIRNHYQMSPEIEKLVQNLLESGAIPIVEELNRLSREDPDEAEETWGELWRCGVKAGFFTPVKLTEEERKQLQEDKIRRAFRPVREDKHE